MPGRGKAGPGRGEGPGMPADIHSAKHPKRLSVESPSPLTRTRERKPRAASSLGQGRGEQLLEAGLEGPSNPGEKAGNPPGPQHAASSCARSRVRGHVLSLGVSAARLAPGAVGARRPRPH